MEGPLDERGQLVSGSVYREAMSCHYVTNISDERVGVYGQYTVSWVVVFDQVNILCHLNLQHFKYSLVKL